MGNGYVAELLLQLACDLEIRGKNDMSRRSWALRLRKPRQWMAREAIEDVREQIAALDFEKNDGELEENLLKL